MANVFSYRYWYASDYRHIITTQEWQNVSKNVFVFFEFEKHSYGLPVQISVPNYLKIETKLTPNVKKLHNPTLERRFCFKQLLQDSES
jgi:hypothetical protein